MSLTAGNNIFTVAEDQIVSLFAKSAKVRTFLSVASEALARAKIYIGEIPQLGKVDEDEIDNDVYLSQFPCIVISAPEDGKWFTVRQEARDNVVQYSVDFRFAVRMEWLVDETKDEQEQIRSFSNAAYGALEEVLGTTSAEPDVFVPTAVEPIDGLYRADFRNRVGPGHIMGTALLFTREITI